MSDTERPQSIRPRAPGDSPGIDHLPEIDVPPAQAITIRCIDYSATRIESREITDLDAFFATPKPEWAVVRWVDVDELHPYIVNRFRRAYGYHTLAAEDALHNHQRPRVEPYENSLYIVARMFMLREDALTSEQISFFLQPGLLVTFQEVEGDCWGSIRSRLGLQESRLRRHGADFLVYALLDAIVDHCFPILERYGDVIEDLEERVLERPLPEQLQVLQRIRRELSTLRRALWPTREVVSALQQRETSISAETRTYLRDVYEHNVQLIDIVETNREAVNSLSELYMSMVSNRMNEIMKVLTIISTIFIPITFLAGVYGMNFQHFPELEWRWAYPIFWGICGTVTLGLLWFFYRRGWLERG